jgi:hypothetical protein
MIEMFGMIEEMNVNEGKYLQFAEMFKQMNININRLNDRVFAIKSIPPNIKMLTTQR